MKRMKIRLVVFAAALALLAPACGEGGLFGAELRRSDEEPTPRVTLGRDVPPIEHSRLADVVEEALPSVVNVRVRSLNLGTLSETEGQGSGVVIDPAGIILTNNHVVQCAVNVRVVFADDTEPADGEVIGTVPERDLAVVRVDRQGLDAIDIGSSAELKLGDQVAAIGFPLGLGGPTVTSGIISGEERTIEPEGGLKLEGLLQTDAAINPGNSGGALIDMAGRLVGINTAAAQAFAAENVGFAIAIDRALPVIEEILEEPPEKRAWLGVIVSSIDSGTIAAQLGLPSDTRGALIRETVEGGPAEQAGLAPGDVITGIEGDTIDSSEALTRVLADLDPGQRVSVAVINAETGQERSEAAELARRPPCPEQ